MRIKARQVATSSVYLLLENILRLGATAAVSFWIARKLGPSQFGVLNFASALTAILLTGASLGLDGPMILRLTRSRVSGAILGSALTLRSIAAAAGFLGIAIVAYLLKRGDQLALEVAMVVGLSLFASVPTAFDYWFKARTRALGPASARAAGTFIAVGAKVACLLIGLGVLALAWTVVLEALVTGIGLYVAYRWYTGGLPAAAPTVDRRLIAPLFRESLPYLYTSIAVILYLKVDIVMLSYLASNTETGVYSLAQKLSEVLYVVPTVLIESAYPALVRRYLSAQDDRGRYPQLLFDLAAGGAMIATILAIMVSGPVIDSVFGSRYSSAVRIFHIHAWSCVAIALNSARYRWLAVAGLQRYAPIVATVGVILNIAINCALIPPLGGMGAAIATVVSYFVSGYATSFMFSPLREMAYMQSRALWPWQRLFNMRRLGGLA